MRGKKWGIKHIKGRPSDLTLGVVLAFLLFILSTASLAGADEAWGDLKGRYRKPIMILNLVDQKLENYQIKFILPYDAGMRWDFSDLYFITRDRKPLSFWLEKIVPGESATVWVKVPSIPARGKEIIYACYGGPTVPVHPPSDVNRTFLRVIENVRGSWNFDEGSGDYTHDSSGFNNHGTLGGYNRTKPEWVSNGRYGGALRFDHENDEYVDCGDDPSMDLGSSCSFEAWVKIQHVVLGGWGWTDIIDRGSWRFLHGTWYIGIQIHKDVPKLNFDICYGYPWRWYDLYGGPDLNDDSWHHLVATYNHPNAAIYVDGVMVNSDPNAPYIRADGDVLGSHLRIGCLDTVDHSPGGLIDEVKIYRKALTPQEVSDLYQHYGYTTPNYPGRVLVRKRVDPEPIVIVGGEGISRVSLIPKRPRDPKRSKTLRKNSFVPTSGWFMV